MAAQRHTLSRRGDTTARVAARLAGGALGILAALGLPASGPAHGAADGVLSWRANATPFVLRIADGDHVLVSHAPPGAAAAPGRRLGYRLADGTFHNATLLLARARIANGERFTLATTEPGRTIRLEVARTSVGVRVRWEPRPSTGVIAVGEAFASSPGEHFTGTGGRQHALDLAGSVLPLKVWAQRCRSGMSIPFFMSSRGYAVRFAATAVGRIVFGPATVEPPCDYGTGPCAIDPGLAAVQVCFKTGSLVYDVLAGSMDELVRAHARLSGRPTLPPRSQFALVKWRDEVSGTADLLEDIDQFQRRSIPLGWVLVDNPWEEWCAGSLSFSASRFPDPAGMVRAVRERGVRVMLWVSPVMRSWCAPNGYPERAILDVDETWRALDLSDAEARGLYEQRLRSVFALGVDGIKGDRADDHDLEPVQLAAGPGTRLHNTYALLFQRSALRALRSESRTGGVAIFRAATAGSQSVVPAVWAGDQTGDFAGLRDAIRHGLGAGLSGFPVWGSDVGGYDSPHLTAQVFQRWAQLGAVSPVLEVGGIGANARPWQLGEQAMEGLRRAAVLHYELHPYHYELARRAAATGVPILRPLAFHYPRDERAWDADLQLLVGRDLLAAPVTEPGTTARVYLPAGRWVDLGRGTVHGGPARLVRPTPLVELPLYLRAGAAIPFDLRLPIWRRPWGLNDLSRPGRAAWLVAPGTTPFTARSTDYGAIAVTPSATGLELRLTGTRREAQVVVLGAQNADAVRVDGRLLPRARSQDALRGRAQGWASRPAPYRGLVLKLAPQRGATTVTIDAG